MQNPNNDRANPLGPIAAGSTETGSRLMRTVTFADRANEIRISELNPATSRAVLTVAARGGRTPPSRDLLAMNPASPTATEERNGGGGVDGGDGDDTISLVDDESPDIVHCARARPQYPIQRGQRR